MEWGGFAYALSGVGRPGGGAPPRGVGPGAELGGGGWSFSGGRWGDPSSCALGGSQGPFGLIVTLCRSERYDWCMSLWCKVCGRSVTWSGRGRRPSVCGQRCRKRASRSTVPDVLKALPRWSSRVGKRPMQPNGTSASSTDPSTWCAHHEVEHIPNGIMLGDGLACWDLDGVLTVDGLHPEAVTVLDEVGEGAVWVERSMSGHGLHVFVWGEGRSWAGTHVSYYSTARFIAVTGDRYVHHTR